MSDRYAAVVVWGLAFLSVVATLACMWVTFRGSRRMYRIGWLEGRGAMMASLADAERRGVDRGVWAISEAVADGLPAYVYDDDDGKP